MSRSVSEFERQASQRDFRSRVRGNLLRISLISVTVGLLFFVLLLPIGVVFYEAFKLGAQAFISALTDSDALHALMMTLGATVLAVFCNGVFGIAAAWCISRFRFPGRKILLTLIDIPFAVSPVVAGLVLVLLYGTDGLLGPVLNAAGIKIIFAFPAIALATLFVTLPFVVRELIPVFEELGTTEEEAALTLGASGWQLFRMVTIPNIRWALMYGLVLTSARALGEFGAVSVVSGHIRGVTNTLPLHIEILYNDFQVQAAFAVASLLALLSMSTLVIKSWVEQHRTREQ